MAVYVDQFLIRGVQTLSYSEQLNAPPMLELKLVVSDVVIREQDAGAPPFAGYQPSDLSASVEEGAYLIGSGPVDTCDLCGMRAHEGACP